MKKAAKEAIENAERVLNQKPGRRSPDAQAAPAERALAQIRKCYPTDPKTSVALGEARNALRERLEDIAQGSWAMTW